MTDQELLQAIRTITREEIKPLKEEVSAISQRLDELEESQEEIRNGVNMLINWSEKVSMAATFPLPDIDD
ncbi:hypothetical protein D7V91_17220 [bacterium 1xD42-67]|nr:hypothetical protein D7V91_17220 [bacterium 1xD42-67]